MTSPGESPSDSLKAAQYATPPDSMCFCIGGSTDELVFTALLQETRHTDDGTMPPILARIRCDMGPCQEHCNVNVNIVG